MLPFDKEFQSGEAKITQVRLDLLLTDNTPLHLTEEHVMMGGFIRDTSTTVDGKFTIGAAVTGKLTVLIDNTDQSFSGYDFRGAIITANLGGESSPDVFQLLQVGIYTVDDYKYDGSVITLTAYDNLYKFDKPCSNTSVTFPITLENLVRQACTVAGVSLANVSIPNGSYSITKEPPQWKTMTWHDVIADCAQIACCFAKALPDGRLSFSWYDAGLFNETQIDGGTFDTNTTPYSDGGTADGGDFDYGSTQSFDGGSFDDRDNVHVLGQLFDLSVDTDDVLITGISVTLAASDNINAVQGTQEYTKTLGTSAYLIKISNNPLIETTANADSVCAYLYNLIVGMRFRPLESSILENPAVEAGDTAIVVDRYDNTYICFISHATYTTGAATRISCDAESPMNNLKARYSEAQKTQALAQRTFERAVLDADAAMQMIMSAYATTMGLYQYTESDGQGGTIYIYGNKDTLESSDIRWKFSAGALMVSSDYGRTWNAAISAEGIAVFQEVYAMKINADNIVAGTITGRAINGGTITGTTISGGTITGTNVNGGIIDGTSINGAVINGTNMNGGIITGSKFISGYNGSTATMYNSTIDLVNSNYNASLSYTGLLCENELTNTYEEGEIRPGSLRCESRTKSGYNLKLGTSLAYTGISFHRAYNQNNPSGYDTIHIRPEGVYNNHIFIDVASDDRHYGRFGFVVNKNNTYYNGIEAPTLYANNLFVEQIKSKIVDTRFGTRAVFSYEMANPMYGDVGSAVIGDDGTALVDIDPIFSDCISQKSEYYVFLQNEGEGQSYIKEKASEYFVIAGTPGMKVAWEMKARQVDIANYRLEELKGEDGNSEPNYAEEAFKDVMDYLDGGTE